MLGRLLRELLAVVTDCAIVMNACSLEKYLGEVAELESGLCLEHSNLNML